MKIKMLHLQWGWITPGTGTNNKTQQWDGHSAFLAEKMTQTTRKSLIVHCGWWLDAFASASVRELTGNNPEPHRNLTPCSQAELNRFKTHVQSGRMEFVAYPYAACVAEGTTGEALLRSFRMSRDIIADLTGDIPRLALNHDAIYGLEWGAAQMPRIARILGFQMLVGMGDHIVESPDGERIRVVGEDSFKHALIHGYESGETTFFAKELAPSIRLLRRLGDLGDEFPALKNVNYEAITLDDYLDDVPPQFTVDSRKIGTKGWFGGCIDSLAMEQNVKRVELRLPILEAFRTLGRAVADGVRHESLDDLWKKAFIIMDNHIIWQCHDYKAHYLPESQQLLREIIIEERCLLNIENENRGDVVSAVNPTPWKRSMIVELSDKSFELLDVPGWGVGECPISTSTRKNMKNRDPSILSNDDISYTLNERGEIIEIDDGTGVSQFDGLGALVRIHEDRRDEFLELKTGVSVKDQNGAFALSTELELAYGYSPEITFEAWDVAGDAFMIESELIYSGGRTVKQAPVAAHNLHWGGRGMPRHKSHVSPLSIRTNGAERVRVKLWVLTEGVLKVGGARFWTGPGEFTTIKRWTVSVQYGTACVSPRNMTADVVKNDGLIKRIRFDGELPDLSFSLFASLRKHSRTLEYKLRLSFPKPTPLGLSSPPFSLEDGSVLGAQCERPYVPGLAIVSPISVRSRYWTDKPYMITPALTKSEKTWHTEKPDWWLGMSPFIGMNMACADDGERQLGLFTRGLKHFFRWNHRICWGDQRPNREMEFLGLSLGASLIHQSTQGHSAPPESPYYDLIKRTSHNPYFGAPFLFAHGDYTFHYAFQTGNTGAKERLRLWRAAREFACPPVPHAGTIRGIPANGINCEPDDVVLTGLETYKNNVLARVVNLSSRTRRAKIKFPFTVHSAETTCGGSTIPADENTIEPTFNPYELKELRLT